MLIRTFQQISDSGLRVSMLDEDSQLPDIATAEQQFIIPAIGQALYDALDEVLDIQAMPAPAPGGPANPVPDEDLVALLPMVQKPLAAFAYLADLPAIHTRLTSSGIRQTTSEGMPTAYRWQYDEMKAFLEERAYHTLEVMLAYLYANAADYTDINTDIQDNRAAQLFTNGAQFATFFQLRQPFRTFIHLQPLLTEVVQQYITPAIGEDFLTELLAEAEPSLHSIKLLASLRYAAANLTISKAVQKLPYRISPDGFTIINAAGGGGAQSTPAEVNVTAQQAGLLQKRAEADGEQAMRRAIKYLQTLATAELWPTFFTSDLYKGPDAYKPDTGNSTRKIFRM
jgi:hypothetical protein